MNAPTPLIDIHPDHWKIVQSILHKHVPQYEVWAFGSRATWKAKEYSDLDLAIITDRPLSLDVSASLSDDFSESDLPWRVDMVDWATTSEAFRKIIERDKVVVWEGGGVGMSNDWRAVSLGELFRVKHGFAFKSEYFTDEPQATVLVTPGNFAIGGGFQDGKRKYYNGQVPEDYVLKPRQVVVTMTDLSKESDTLGYAASIPNDSTIWLHNQRVGLLEFKTDIPTSPRFIEYLLRTHEYRSWIVGSATGTTVKHTAPGRIESFATRIPPIKEQRAIAQILGTLDDKIELNRRSNETLEAMAHTLFKAWFVDFEPVRAKIEGRWQRGESLPGLPAHLYDLFPNKLVESELGEIPEGWRCGALSNLANYLNGYAFKTKDWKNSGHPVVKIGNVKPGLIDVSGTSCVSPETVVGLERFKLSRGDLLVGMTGYVGETGLVPSIEPPAYLNQRVGKFSTKCGLADLGFVYCLVRNQDYKTYAELKSHGSAQANVSGTDLMAYPCVLPEPRILDQFNGMLCPIIRDILENHDESQSLAQLRHTLLPKLISGELRVPDTNHILRA